MFNAPKEATVPYMNVSGKHITDCLKLIYHIFFSNIWCLQILQPGTCIGMPQWHAPGLKISDCTNQILFDSTWTAGVDYDQEEIQDNDYDMES